MLIRISFAAVILLLVSGMLPAQENQSSPATGTDRQEDEERSRGPLERIVAEILRKNIESESSALFQPKDLFAIEGFQFGLAPDYAGGQAVTVDVPAIPVLPKMKFSFAVPYPQIGSPAYEVTGVVRHSLSMDPITGKYYWEW
jgi:hypothetical protein